MCCYTSGDGESSSFANRESQRRPGRASAICVHGKALEAAASCHVARRGVASALGAVTGQQVKRGREMLQGSAAACLTHLIDLALHHGFHGGVLHHLSQHSAVAAADDEHLGRERREGGVRGPGGLRDAAARHREACGEVRECRNRQAPGRRACGRRRGRGAGLPCEGQGGCRAAGWRSSPGRRTRPAPCIGSPRPGPGRCRRWCWAKRGSGVGTGPRPRSPRSPAPRGPRRPRPPPRAAPAEDEDLLVAGALVVQELLHLQRHGLPRPQPARLAEPALADQRRRAALHPGPAPPPHAALPGPALPAPLPAPPAPALPRAPPDPAGAGAEHRGPRAAAPRPAPVASARAAALPLAASPPQHTHWLGVV